MLKSIFKSPRTILISIFLIAFLLRAFQFSMIPPGLYFDEATAGYESFSLLRTGADRWNISFPPYFANWGNGQNVLYSYLSIPFVQLFGLSRFSIRLLSLFLGILTLPILYATVKRRMGERTALITSMMLAILPWHIQVSRWALDSNILPFFILLGIYTMTRALERNASRGWIVFALVPWGLALYAYVLSSTVIPIMLGVIVLFRWKALAQNWKTWLMSAFLFGVITLPMILFLFKNYVVHNTMGIEKFLPFGVPLLLSTRWQSVTSPIPTRWIDMFFFILSGFQEGDYHDSILGHAPLFFFLLPLGIVGAVRWIQEFRRTKALDLFGLWLIASIPLLFLVDANVHRFNSIILPLLVAAAFGLVKLGTALNARPASRKILFTGIAALAVLQAGWFAFDYFFVLPNTPEFQSAYAANYDRAIAKGLELAPPSDPILLAPSLEFAYIYILFYTNYPPAQFHREVKYTLDFAEYWVTSFGRFYIGAENLPNPDQPFSFILHKSFADPCPNPTKFWETRLWKVGRCEP